MRKSSNKFCDVEEISDVLRTPSSEPEGAPELQKIPIAQVEGDLWIMAVLDDLIAYSDYRELSNVPDLLRSTRQGVARALLN